MKPLVIHVTIVLPHQQIGIRVVGVDGQHLFGREELTPLTQVFMFSCEYLRSDKCEWRVASGRKRAFPFHLPPATGTRHCAGAALQR
jgi:hypothetical protein